MDGRTALKKLAERKTLEIDALRIQLAQAEAYLQAVQDSIRLLPREQDGHAEVSALRQGTAIAHARDVLKDAGRPMHILEILRKMGRADNKENRVSLSGSIAAYVRRNQVFRKAGPNIFALREDPSKFGASDYRELQTLPENFGKMDAEERLLSDLSPFKSSPNQIQTSLLPDANEGQLDGSTNDEINAVRESVSDALTSAGHVSASQMLRNAKWSIDGDCVRIEVAGIGRKMLALTVNAAAEKVIRSIFVKAGYGTRFLVTPSVPTPN
jgi:hypothetical protein